MQKYHVNGLVSSIFAHQKCEKRDTFPCVLHRSSPTFFEREMVSRFLCAFVIARSPASGRRGNLNLAINGNPILHISLDSAQIHSAHKVMKFFLNIFLDFEIMFKL